MKNYSFSIIVPVYNGEKFLDKCLSSLINQSYKKLEIIVVNDASTDNSLNIINSYLTKTNNLKVINLNKNMRQGNARNKGIEVATGDYLSFVDCDDWIDLDRYENVNKKLQNNEVDVILCSSYYREYVNNNTTIINECDSEFFKSLKNHVISESEHNQLIYKGSGVCQNIYKNNIIKNNNIKFPINLSYEDNYFVPLFFCYVKTVDYIETPFYHYRQNFSSTVYRRDNTQLQRFEVYNLLTAELNKRNLLVELQDGFDILYLKHYFLGSLGILYKFYPDKFIKLSNDLRKTYFSKYPNVRKNRFYKHDVSKIEKLKLNLIRLSPHLLFLLYKIKK